MSKRIGRRALAISMPSLPFQNSAIRGTAYGCSREILSNPLSTVLLSGVAAATTCTTCTTYGLQISDKACLDIIDRETEHQPAATRPSFRGRSCFLGFRYSRKLTCDVGGQGFSQTSDESMPRPVHTSCICKQVSDRLRVPDIESANFGPRIFQILESMFQS